MPFVKPVIEHVNAVVVEHVPEPGDEVTEYPVMAEPPEPGAVHETTDWPFAYEVAETPVGADGTVDGTAEAEAAEAAEGPLAFEAVTVNV